MKRGFTLIEIMVVIVVLGILAAVALPKLFGQIAKAKASEIPVAAGAYMKLQDAHLTQKPEVGTWKSIGFIAPGGGTTSYFQYSDCLSGDIDLESLDNAIGLRIASLTGLNDCPAGSLWAVSMSPGNGNSVNYQQIFNSTNCQSLTVTWSMGDIAECSATSTNDNSKP